MLSVVKRRSCRERDNNAIFRVEECIEYTVLCCYYLKKCWRRKISSRFLVFSGKKVYFCEIFLAFIAKKAMPVK